MAQVKDLSTIIRDTQAANSVNANSGSISQPSSQNLPTTRSSSCLSKTCSSNSLSKTYSDAVVNLLSTYSTGEEMLVAYNPSKISHLLTESNLERIYLGRAPEISVVRVAYGETVVVGWLEIQLSHVSEFAGVKEHMPPEVINELARIIMGEFFYLKLSELMLFFARLMSGRYGTFYNIVDPIHICYYLRTFISERNDEIDRIYRHQSEIRRQQELQSRQENAITYEEYKRDEARD